MARMWAEFITVAETPTGATDNISPETRKQCESSPRESSRRSVVMEEGEDHE
jgi:hypothetical protein